MARLAAQAFGVLQCSLHQFHEAQKAARAIDTQRCTTSTLLAMLLAEKMCSIPLRKPVKKLYVMTYKTQLRLQGGMQIREAAPALHHGHSSVSAVRVCTTEACTTARAAEQAYICAQSTQLAYSCKQHTHTPRVCALAPVTSASTHAYTHPTFLRPCATYGCQHTRLNIHTFVHKQHSLPTIANSALTLRICAPAPLAGASTRGRAAGNEC
eukprot:scaffold41054_cov20-Tisochrysis_lutea.AAC.3